MILDTKLKIKNIVISGSLLLLLGCSSSDEKQTVTTMTQLVKQDEFNVDGATDGSMWNIETGIGPNNDGWGNNELEYYTSFPQNIKVEGGVLKITAIKEAYMGKGYTSARITSKGKFEQKHGRFEARIKMPWGKGVWPAFWLLGANSSTVSWPQCGEIDIMEYLGNNPTSVFGTVHGPGYSGANAISKVFNLTNDRFDTGYHIFGIEWGEDYINYYVDNVLYNQITPAKAPGEWVFNQPFYIILNVAVGGNLPGSPNNETVFPQTMLVDYVRVYQ